MEMDNLNRWLSLIANIGVLVGIVFLGIEIRQNTLYLQQGEQNITFDQVTISRMMGMDADMAELIIRASEDQESLSKADKFRLGQYTNQWMWTSYNIFQREANGYLEPGEWERSGRPIFLVYLNNPMGRSAWQQYGSTFPPDFRQRVDEIFSE